MTASDSSNPLERFTHHVRRRWGWFLALGIIYLIGGIAAIFLPVMSSIAFTIVIASFLVVGGIVQIIQSFQMNGWQGVVWHLLMGIITLVGGGYALWNPIAGALAITLVIAITFIAQGVVEIVMGFRLRPVDGWGWMIASGVLAVLAGIALTWTFPASGLVTVGTIAGIAMIFTGWSYIYIAMAARRVWKDLKEDVGGMGGAKA
ncbi:HdeD family acid-resistance protein [Paradevosia shaoguanensis]|uniref:HdeD family acid-resistance protein n=1 Tax=Paradevosia shaoguanensis TaxID=1335043 RepID=UPI000455C0AA|nr:HdeD family acid-resistance protein [Paradevosia shaoguanensis]MBI4048481.1 HdeD family acid-resistance protein [Devosia nanyangense]QMV02294.1 HdeD family acid-resistance protein [Devosia sp. D6-9]CDP54298.1 HDED PROTEIN [Devosia sp. DBB001]